MWVCQLEAAGCFQVGRHCSLDADHGLFAELVELVAVVLLTEYDLGQAASVAAARTTGATS